MTTFGKTISGAAKAGTADSFDDLGTITLSDKARHVHGLLVSWAEASKRTADEASMAQMRYSSMDNGLGNQIITLLGGTGGAPATNVAPVGRQQMLIPLDVPVAGNSKFQFEVSTHLPDPTETSDFAISILFNDGNLGDMYKFWPGIIPMKGSDAECNAAVTATTETAITDLDIPGWAREIVGFQFNVAPDTVQTDGDPVVPIFILRSSFRDFDPQEYVGPSISSPLGTAVGDGLIAWGILIPVSIPILSPANQTITPNVKLTTTSAVSIAIAADVFYR